MITQIQELTIQEKNISCQNKKLVHSASQQRWSRMILIPDLDPIMLTYWKLFPAVLSRNLQCKEKEEQEINKIFQDLVLIKMLKWVPTKPQIIQQLSAWAKDSAINMIRTQDLEGTMSKRRKVVSSTQWQHREETAWVIRVKLQAQEHIMILIKELLEAELQMSSFLKARKIFMLKWLNLLQDLDNIKKMKKWTKQDFLSIETILRIELIMVIWSDQVNMIQDWLQRTKEENLQSLQHQEWTQIGLSYLMNQTRMPTQDLDIMQKHHSNAVKHSKWELALNSTIRRVVIQDQASTTQLRILCCQTMVQTDLESLKETMISYTSNQQHLIQDQVLIATIFQVGVESSSTKLIS